MWFAGQYERSCPQPTVPISSLSTYLARSHNTIYACLLFTLCYTLAPSPAPNSLSVRSILNLKRWDPILTALHSTLFPLHLTNFHLLTFGFLHQTLDILVSVTLSRSPSTTAFDKPSEPSTTCIVTLQAYLYAPTPSGPLIRL